MTWFKPSQLSTTSRLTVKIEAFVQSCGDELGCHNSSHQIKNWVGPSLVTSWCSPQATVKLFVLSGTLNRDRKICQNKVRQSTLWHEKSGLIRYFYRSCNFQALGRTSPSLVRLWSSHKSYQERIHSESPETIRTRKLFIQINVIYYMILTFGRVKYVIHPLLTVNKIW